MYEKDEEEDVALTLLCRQPPLTKRSSLQAWTLSWLSARPPLPRSRRSRTNCTQMKRPLELASNLPLWEGAREDHRTERDPPRRKGQARQPEARLTTQDPVTPSPAPPSPHPWALCGPTQARTLWSRHLEGTRSVLQHAGGISWGHRLPSGAIPRGWVVTPPSPQPPNPHLPGAAQAASQTSLTLVASRCSWDPSGFHRAS